MRVLVLLVLLVVVVTGVKQSQLLVLRPRRKFDKKHAGLLNQYNVNSSLNMPWLVIKLLFWSYFTHFKGDLTVGKA